MGLTLEFDAHMDIDGGAAGCEATWIDVTIARKR